MVTPRTTGTACTRRRATYERRRLRTARSIENARSALRNTPPAGRPRGKRSDRARGPLPGARGVLRRSVQPHALEPVGATRVDLEAVHTLRHTVNERWILERDVRRGRGHDRLDLRVEGGSLGIVVLRLGLVHQRDRGR